MEDHLNRTLEWELNKKFNLKESLFSLNLKESLFGWHFWK